MKMGVANMQQLLSLFFCFADFETRGKRGDKLQKGTDVDTKAATVVPSKDTPVYVYCRGGREATMATEKLLKQGYTDVHNLGAMKNAQEKLDLPVSK